MISALTAPWSLNSACKADRQAGRRAAADEDIPAVCERNDRSERMVGMTVACVAGAACVDYCSMVLNSAVVVVGMGRGAASRST